MKTTIYSLLAAAACGMAYGQTAYTTPVGYTTTSIVNGFNFVGLNVHEPIAAAGTLETINAGSVVDNDLNFTSTLTAGAAYVLEIDNGTGIIQEITSWSGNSLTTAANLTANVAVGAKYALRKRGSLKTVFGDTAPQLSHGSFGVGTADQIWIFNGTGYNKYYYDDVNPNTFTPTWRQFEPIVQNIVDANSVKLVYSDAFLIVSATVSPKNLTFSGEVKLTPTEINLANGFTFVSAVAPVGATLGSAYGATAATLAHGSFGPGTADQIWIFNGTGYNKYYYDDVNPSTFTPSWRQLEPVVQNIANPSTIPLPAGYLMVSTGGNAVQGVPAWTTP